jgi:hypothetical protein
LVKDSQGLKEIKEAIPSLTENLFTLFSSEISLDLLKESGIGLTLKYFLDYCKLYEPDL